MDSKIMRIKKIKKKRRRTLLRMMRKRKKRMKMEKKKIPMKMRMRMRMLKKKRMKMRKKSIWAISGITNHKTSARPFMVVQASSASRTHSSSAGKTLVINFL